MDLLAVDLSVHQITFYFFLFQEPFPALHSIRSLNHLVRESNDRSNRRSDENGFDILWMKLFSPIKEKGSLMGEAVS
jgi:hypothetical protein